MYYFDIITEKIGGTLNTDNINLDGCDFNKADGLIVEQMVLPESNAVYSGDLEGYYKLLVNKKLISDSEVPVLVRVKSEADWRDAIVDGMEVLTGGTIFGAWINFEALIALLKNPIVVSISWSAPSSGID